MSDEVVFDEDPANLVGNIRIVPSAPTGMLAWLVKSKIVKNAKQAEGALISVAVVALLLAVVIFIVFDRSHTYVRPDNLHVPGAHGTLLPVAP